MNDEIREEFLNLYSEMVLAHQRWHGQSISALGEDERNRASLISNRYQYYGGVLDGIRLGIQELGYSGDQQHNLLIILTFARDVGDSTLADRLQNIINLLGDPPRSVGWVVQE